PIGTAYGLASCAICNGIKSSSIQATCTSAGASAARRPYIRCRATKSAILDEAKQEGIAEKTLRRAKKDLGVKSRKEGGKIEGGWVWGVPKKATIHPNRESWPSSYCQGFEHVVVVEHIALNRDPCACRPPCDSCT